MLAEEREEEDEEEEREEEDDGDEPEEGMGTGDPTCLDQLFLSDFCVWKYSRKKRQAGSDCLCVVAPHS